MKYLSVAAILVALFEISSSQIPTPIEVSTLFDLLEEMPTDVNCSNESPGIGKRCRDNATVEICVMKIPMIRVKCEGPRPGCDVATGNCAPLHPRDEFSCPAANGYFPKPGNCRSYYICVVGEAHEVLCPKGNYVYSDRLKACARQSYERPCYDFPCSGKPAGFPVAYPGNPRFYTVCDGRGSPTELMDCGDDRTSFAASEKGCRLKCDREENIPAWDDPLSLKYYECYRINSYTFGTVERWCPEGTVFHTELRRCVAPQTSLPC